MRIRAMKRYLIPIMVISVLTSGLIAGCGQKATSTEIYCNYQYGYVIEYPSSWTLDDSGETVHISRPLHEYVSIGVLEGKRPTAEESEWLFDNMVKEMATSIEDFQLISKARLYDIGHLAWQAVWTGKTGEGVAVMAKTRSIAHEDKVYVITAGAPGLELPPELETTISSFCFLGERTFDVNLDEKRVIEMTYDYLISKAEQLQGFDSWLNKIRLRNVFEGALFKAVLDYDEPDRSLGELVYLHFTKPEPWERSIFTSELEKIVKYDGNRGWSLSVGDREWYFDERTLEVVAQNKEAASQLEEITLKTYHNSEYGYYVDYPPSWVINDEDKSHVFVSSNLTQGKQWFNIWFIGEFELVTYESMQRVLTIRLDSFSSQFYDFEVTKTTPVRTDYIYQEREDSSRREARYYLVQYEGKVYEIICSGGLSVPGGDYSNLYDPYESFRFQS